MNPYFLHLTSIESTNAFLLEKAETQNVVNYVVYADYQSHGKGMGNNTWESEPLKNLTFSMALDTAFIDVANQFQISQTVAVALHRCLSEYVDTDGLQVKWPNDILFENRKLAGVLISNILKDNNMNLSVIGIGLNVNQTSFMDWPTNPVSMKMITGMDYDLKSVLDDIVDKTMSEVESLKSGYYQQINEYYLSKLYRYRQWGNYLVGDDEKRLFMKGLDRFGRILLCDSDSVEYAFDVKQIKFLM